MGLFSSSLCKNALSIFLSVRRWLVHLTPHGNAACPGCCWVPAALLTDHQRPLWAENLRSERMNVNSPGWRTISWPLCCRIHSLNCSKKTSTLDFWESIAIIYKNYWLRGQNIRILLSENTTKRQWMWYTGVRRKGNTATWTSQLSEHSPHPNQWPKGSLSNTSSALWGATTSAGLAWHNMDTRALSQTCPLPLIPTLHTDLEHCQTPGTLETAMSYFTHTGPFEVSLLQAGAPRGPVGSEGLDRSSLYQSVIRAGELKSDEFYSVKHQPSVSRGCQRGLCEEEDWPGMCKRAACRSDSGMEFTASSD